jgi:predicted ATPase
MKRFILTGAPGSGKTALLRQLENDGFGVVEEAATDVIALWQARGMAEPWTHSSFIDLVTELQRQRELRTASEQVEVQFHDRSVVCTAALAKYLNFPPSMLLTQELHRIRANAVFEKTVFFVRNLGFITATNARRISFEETLRFEKIHEETYREYGFDVEFIDAGPLDDRIATIKRTVIQADCT